MRRSSRKESPPWKANSVLCGRNSTKLGPLNHQRTRPNPSPLCQAPGTDPSLFRMAVLDPEPAPLAMKRDPTPRRQTKRSPLLRPILPRLRKVCGLLSMLQNDTMCLFLVPATRLQSRHSKLATGWHLPLPASFRLQQLNARTAGGRKSSDGVKHPVHYIVLILFSSTTPSSESSYHT